MQGRNEVRWRPGQKTILPPLWSNWRPHGRSLAPPWLNLSSFKSKFTMLKKVLVRLIGLFGGSLSNSAPPLQIASLCGAHVLLLWAGGFVGFGWA